MKKIKLFSLLAATLFAGSTMAQTTLFEWTCGTAAPNTDSVSIASDTYGTMTVGTDILNRQFGTSNKMAYDKGYYKISGNDIAIEIQGIATFEAGDTVVIVGKNGGDGNRGFEIGNSSAAKAGTTGNVLSSTANHTRDTTFTALVDANIAGTTLRVFRLAGKTMYVKSIKVVRPAPCTDAELSLSENPDIEANEGETLTAPVLTNPKNVAVTYASSDENVVTVAEDGSLTSVGAGDAVITITAARQTVSDVLYCADELTYNVTIKSLSPVLEATESALDFSLSAFETTKSATFTVSGYNLTGEASISELPAGFTLAPATLTIEGGEVNQEYTLTYTAEEAVAAGSADLVFTVGETKVTIALDYGKKAKLTQTTVTDSTTWDWTKASTTEEIRLTADTKPSKNDTILLADYDGITNDETFRSDALVVCGEYLIRGSKYFQGGYISFNADKKGFVVVNYSNTGGNAARSLVVNGTKDAAVSSAASSATVTSSKMAVNAGKVVVMFAETADDTNKSQYARVYSITYTVDNSGDIGSAVEQAQTEVKAVKVIRDGQLLIIREGKTYTAQGVEVR